MLHYCIAFTSSDNDLQVMNRKHASVFADCSFHLLLKYSMVEYRTIINKTSIDVYILNFQFHRNHVIILLLRIF